jgi:hypothetical protein
VRLVLVERLISPVAAHARQRFVDGDSCQPGGKPGPAVELAQVRVGIHVRLLHHVLGLLLVADDGAGGTVEALVVAPHQDLEKSRLAVQHLRDDLFVRERAPALEHLGVRDVHA